MSSVKTSLRLGHIFHFLVVVYYVYVDYFAATIVVPPILQYHAVMLDNVVLLAPQYATIWVLLFQEVYFFCSFAEDLLLAVGKPNATLLAFRRSLTSFTTTMFTCFTFPFSILICLVFWTLFTHDPGNLDRYRIIYSHLSAEMNHVCHTLIVPIAFIELWTTPRQYPKCKTAHFKTIAWTFAAFLLTTLTLQPFTSMWVYPFYGTSSAFGLTLVALTSVFVTILAYCLGHYVNSIVWGQELQHPVSLSPKSIQKCKLR